MRSTHTRNYQQQFRALVKHRKKKVPDIGEFTGLFNDYLLQYGIKPLPVDVVQAIEDDLAAGVSATLVAYLSFLGTRLVIDGVAKDEYRAKSEEQMARNDENYIREKEAMLASVRISNLHGPNIPKVIRIRIQQEDGSMCDAHVNNIYNAAAWDKVKEGMLMLMRDSIEARMKEAEVRRSKMSAPKPLKGI